MHEKRNYDAKSIYFFNAKSDLSATSSTTMRNGKCFRKFSRSTQTRRRKVPLHVARMRVKYENPNDTRQIIQQRNIPRSRNRSEMAGKHRPFSRYVGYGFARLTIEFSSSSNANLIRSFRPSLRSVVSPFKQFSSFPFLFIAPRRSPAVAFYRFAGAGGYPRVFPRV